MISMTIMQWIDTNIYLKVDIIKGNHYDNVALFSYLISKKNIIGHYNQAIVKKYKVYWCNVAQRFILGNSSSLLYTPNN